MTVLVGSSVWSLALRRRPTDLNLTARSIVHEWRELVREGRVAIVGPLRQEVLSGIRDEARFEKLRKLLTAFRDTPLVEEDFVQAAGFYNRCRKRGVTAAPIDLLLCAAAHRTLSTSAPNSNSVHLL